jgi:hypothetical protein
VISDLRFGERVAPRGQAAKESQNAKRKSQSRVRGVGGSVKENQKAKGKCQKGKSEEPLLFGL